MCCKPRTCLCSGGAADQRVQARAGRSFAGIGAGIGAMVEWLPIGKNMLACAGSAPQPIVEVCVRRRNLLFSILVGLVIFAAGFWAGGKSYSLAGPGLSIAATPPAVGASKTVLFEAVRSWDGTEYGAYPAGNADIKIVKIVIPPHTRLASHTHPMPNIAYVVAGELLVETEDGMHKTTLKPGQVLPEMVNTSHRGTSGKAPVELIVFYAGTPGMPLSH